MPRRSPATVPGARKGARPANKDRRYRPEVLTPDEARQLLAAPSATAPTGIRNRALLAVLYRAGLRAAEAMALERRDLDPERGYVTVRHGKGDEHRTVGMDAAGFAFVQRWLDTRTRLGIPGRLVFCTLDGRPLQPSYVRALLPRLAAKAGIDKRVHAHGLRHTLAAEMAHEGRPVNVIQAQLGHKSLHTTTTYLAHISPADLAKVMQSRTWTPLD
jgi:site-specific recombinase XerD